MSGQPRVSAARTGRRGLSMIETVVSTALVGITIVAALTAVGGAARGNSSTADAARGQLLAHALLTEILTKAYSDLDQAAAFGPEELPAVRANFDDVDDYHNLDETPPMQVDGTGMTELTGWRRQVRVKWATAADLRVDSLIETGIKRVTVVVSRNGFEVARLETIRTDMWQRPGDDYGS